MKRQLLKLVNTFQGIINMNRNGNFCKGTCISKVIAETKGDARFEQRKCLPVFLICLQWQICCVLGVLGALLRDNR